MLDYVDTDVTNGTTYYYMVKADIPFYENSDRLPATPSAGGQAIRARWADNAVTVDGQIASGEWADARAINIANPEAPEPIFLYVKNDNTKLYLAVDDPNDVIVDPANIMYFIFDQDNDNLWDPSSLVTEGAIAFNSSAVAYSGYAGDYPGHFNMAAATVPTGAKGVLSAASGHVQYEMSIDLTTSPLTAEPGETIGAFIWVFDPGMFYPYHKGNAGEWPAGALWDAATPLGDLTLAEGPAPVVTNFDWPMANGGRERTSWAIGETQLYPPFEHSTEFSTGSEFAAYLACFDNTLYASIDGFPNVLIAFDVKSQTELWRFTIPYTGGDCFCTPAVNNSMVFIGGQSGRGLYALDRWTSEQKWLKEIGTMILRHPIVDDAYIYVISRDSLFCLQTDDGETVWSQPVSGSGPSAYSPLVDEQQVYAVINGELWTFDKLTGVPGWHVPNDNRALVADADAVYSINGFQIVALAKSSGTLLWSYPFPESVIESSSNVMAISDDALCFALERNNANRNAELYVLDKTTGAYRWHYVFAGRGDCFPTIANDVVYGVFGAYGLDHGDGSLWGFDINTGATVFYDNSVRYCQQPIVAGHTLFVPSAGAIKAFSNQPVPVHPTDVDAHPSHFSLEQNYPNPFNPETVIEYRMKERCQVALKVYDIRGSEVATLVQGIQTPGSYRATFDARQLASGVYFYKIQMQDFQAVRKMVLLE